MNENAAEIMQAIALNNSYMVRSIDEMVDDDGEITKGHFKTRADS